MGNGSDCTYRLGPGTAGDQVLGMVDWVLDWCRLRQLDKRHQMYDRPVHALITTRRRYLDRMWDYLPVEHGSRMEQTQERK